MPGAVGGIVGGLAKGLLAKGASKIFGGGSAGRTQSTIAARDPVGFRSGGMSADFNKGAGRFDIRRSAGVEGALTGIGRVSAGTAGEFRSLRSRLGSGFEALGEARLARLDDSRRRATGGLREELRRRRMGGSTFANQATAELETQFALAADEIEAESFLQSLSAASELIGKEFAASLEGVTRILDQYNFESEVAASMTNSANSLQASANAAQAGIAQATAGIDADNATGFGEILSPAIEEVSRRIGGIFGPAESSPAEGNA